MNRTRSLVASAAAVVVAAAGLTLTTPAPPAAASTSFTLTPSTPIVGESFAATGRVSTRFKRPVALRVYSAGAWRTARTGWTTSSGTYRLAATGVSAATAFGVVARAYRHKGRTYGRTVSATRTVRPVAQSASTYVLPQISQRGTGPAAAGAALNSVVAKFRPARPGRPVTFQRLVNGSWVSSAPTPQRADGTALYRGALGGFHIRAVTAARYGAPAFLSPEAVDTWGLRFSDEFSGDSLNTDVWTHRNLGIYIPGRTQSKTDPRAAVVGGGTVALSVKKDPSSSTKLLNGQISTQNHYRFTYGVAAARVRFQQGRGAHGSFWLQSPAYGAIAGNPAASGAEIDVTEFFGQGYPSGGLASFVYYKGSNGQTVRNGGVWPAAARLKPSSDSWWNSYHVFAVDWTPQGYTFYVDGQQLYTTSRGLSRHEQFLILSLLSSDWELKSLDRTRLSTKSVMRVDWARVWQR